MGLTYPYARSGLTGLAVSAMTILLLVLRRIDPKPICLLIQFFVGQQRLLSRKDLIVEFDVAVKVS